MRRWLVLAASVALAAPASVAGQAERGPGETVEVLFQHMKAGDADAMQSLMHPDVRLVSTSVRDGVPSVQVMGADRWIEGVRSSTRELDERIYDTVVNVDGGLASVWTRYDLFVDGTHSHCGVDHVLLVRHEGEWKIIHLADTRSREGCRGS